MQFNKSYNRQEFVNFLRDSFLPDDFQPIETPVKLHTQTKYTGSVTKLGACPSLDLVVYEIQHHSKNDARVGLSKEAFRVLADEWEDRALVIFVPEESASNYRFSLITVDLDMTDTSKLNKRYSNPRRYSYYLGTGIATHTPVQFLIQKGRVANEEDLKNRFSVEVLTKAFYNELSDWYAWAVRIVRFPNKIDDSYDDDKFNAEATIRLVTRLIFVWFLKQKHLIPDEFFDEKYIADNLLNSFEPNAIVNLFGKSEESCYYKAILQNLFFAMLNSPITPEDKDTISERRFRNGRSDYDNNKLMRYESMFANPALFVELANKTVPFLNGGLFDCLDDKDNGNYVDGFSDREAVQRALIVPDYLFFGDTVGKNIDLSEWYGDASKKKVSASGIIDILKRYNFTVEENTPYDQEVSLDPELLGKVFENLLASYNPETKTTARKQTGSFYTPREIVQYMVDESIIAHLNKTVGKDLEPEYRKLVSYTDEILNLTQEQKSSIINALYDCKVLDPACGSGAFPMGILQQMVHILSELDPSNEMWEELILNKAIQESDDKDIQLTQDEKEEKRRDIERSFNESLNHPDYARKLYLIENCIYGVDIQPIAIQISKLRFFISLVVDQKANSNPVENFGIRPLPNLEAKFVAANSLIGLKKNNSLFVTNIIDIEEQLQKANHKIFSAKTYKTKRKYREILKTLRREMVEELAEIEIISNDQIEQLASWDMFDQNSFASFFDPEWMFGVSTGFDIVIGNPPILRGRDIKRYGYEWANLYLIATFPARHYNIDSFPAVKEYLLSFAYDSLLENGNDWVAKNYLVEFCKQKLEQTGQEIIINGKYVLDPQGHKEKSRKRTNNKWFETQDSISYWEDFFKPKVMYPNMTKFIPFYYDVKGFFQNDKSFMITGHHIAYLTAFLNSSLFKFCFLNNFPELQGGTRELRKVFFDKIPVKDVPHERDQQYATLIMKMQEQPDAYLAKEIDNMLFEDYDLTQEEQATIGFVEIV
uniref:Eco57I restriction-modification methylase domain-containing protein n=1 Tax=Candidatus Cryptobacteroides bacterium TaxID=3085639 RepID=UPI004029AE62